MQTQTKGESNLARCCEAHDDDEHAVSKQPIRYHQHATTCSVRMARHANLNLRTAPTSTAMLLSRLAKNASVCAAATSSTTRKVERHAGTKKTNTHKKKNETTAQRDSRRLCMHVFVCLSLSLSTSLSLSRPLSLDLCKAVWLTRAKRRQRFARKRLNMELPNDEETSANTSKGATAHESSRAAPLQTQRHASRLL